MRATVFFLVYALFLWPMSFTFAAAGVDYDVLITNARIVDGNGNPWFGGSIAIQDGRIVKVGRFVPGNAKRFIDARGQIVAPGFIDVHTHVEDVYDNPKAENFIR